MEKLIIRKHIANKEILIKDGFIIDKFSANINKLILIAHHKDGRKVEIIV
jgi:hypothetical protein